MISRKFNIITMGIIFAVLLTFGAQAQERNTDRQIISVSGTGEVFVSPDVANISFSVETTAQTASEAVAGNAASTTKVLDALKSQIGEKDNLATSGYNLSPVYEYNNETRKSEFKGYKATNTVSVRTLKLDNIGTLIDSATKAGANNIQGLSFNTTKRNDHRREALKKAVQDAKATAETLAAAAGVQITNIYQISAPTYSQPTPIFEARAKFDAGAAPPPPTPIEAGDISIQASVNMVFGIE